jgi:DNA-directed RNA polymerase specialized sigma24 family protein
MRFGRDPLEDVEKLIPRVYVYLAYRLGHGPDAEDLTSECFERALRYRHRYDPGRGEPLAWLIGIARRLVADHRSTGWHEELDFDTATTTDECRRTRCADSASRRPSPSSHRAIRSSSRCATEPISPRGRSAP